MQYITGQLVEKRQEAEKLLKKMSIEQSNAVHGVNDTDAVTGNEIAKIRRQIDYCK